MTGKHVEAERSLGSMRRTPCAASRRRGTLRSALRAEMLKSRHAAPVRLAVLMALPFPALSLLLAFANPLLGVPYTLWNYWYALLLPVTTSLVVVCVARTDARLGNRALLSSGVPLERAWAAKSIWCLMLSALSNLVVLALFLLAYGLVCIFGDASAAASVPDMFAAAGSLVVLNAWMIPVGLALTMRFGLLAGIFAPMAFQIACGFAWSIVPMWPLVPPVATMVVPTAFLPVLPSGEPLSAASPALLGALGSFQAPHAVALVVAAALFAALTLAGARRFARSETR